MAEARYDAVVVGARLAGSTVAALLGDAGHSVLLVDRATFPSPTLSTHFFRGGGLGAILDRLGVLDEVLALGPPRLVRERWTLGPGRPPQDRGPQNPGQIGYSLSVRRIALDHVLLARAAGVASVEVRQATVVRDLLRDPGGAVRGVMLAGGDGTRSEALAPLVIGADGRHSTVARLAGAAVQADHGLTRPLYYRYFTGFGGGAAGTPEAAEFSLHGDELAYVFPSDAGCTCVALSIGVDDFAAFRRDAEGGFSRRLSAHPELADRIAGAAPASRVLGCGPGKAIGRRPWGPGWALAGDASLHWDPFSGLGMDFAAAHAARLADEAARWLDGRCSQNAALTAYRRARDEALTTFRQVSALSSDLRQLAGGI